MTSYYLYNLTRIRKYLSKDNTKTLIHAFISSRVDYRNSLLYGLPKYQLNKLQRLQNMCARLLCNESKYCHITPLLVDFHWLPVKFRIEFKILLTVFKIFKGLAPSSLSFLITTKPVSKYNLRSSSDITLLSRMLSPRQLSVNGPFCLLHLSYGMLCHDLSGNLFQLTLLRES